MFHLGDAAVIFLIVLAFGTLWRLASQHLAVSNNANLQHLGRAMSYQY